jgi:hypothetical protein
MENVIRLCYAGERAAYNASFSLIPTHPPEMPQPWRGDNRLRGKCKLTFRREAYKVLMLEYSDDHTSKEHMTTQDQEADEGYEVGLTIHNRMEIRYCPHSSTA